MKRQVSNRFVIAAMLVALLPFFVAAGHQDKAESTAQFASPGGTDRFIGVWKLNADKSSNSGTLRESIVIEPQGKEFKLTYDWSAENGTELHWWYVTDMKGGIVNPTQTNGKPMSGKPRITRIDSGSFKVESEVQRDIYRVNADGQTMKLQRTYLVQVGRPNMAKDVLLLFDRQK
jgi:hypothetical protein